MLLARLLLQGINTGKPIFLVISLSLLFLGEIWAKGLGGYGGAHLRAPVGATAFALGGAQTAAPSYLYSWWNPAALAYLKQKKLSLGGGYRTLGRTESYLSFEFPIPSRAAMSMSMLYRGDPRLHELVDEQEYPLENGAYTTLSFKTGFSYLVKRNFSVGFNFSVYYQRLPTGFERDGDLIYSSVTAIGGFDLGIIYIPRKNLRYGLIIKNIMANFNWEFKQEEFNPMFQDSIPATITLGQELKFTLMDKPFIWTYDIIGYFFNSNFKPIDHIHAVINNGFEWQKWDLFHIRAGIRDITLNRNLLKHKSTYKKHFSLAISLGFQVDLTKVLKEKNIVLNYGVANDKVGNGLDQQLDFIWGF